VYKELFIVRNRYVDSVSLMNVQARAMDEGGVHLAEVQMGTPINIHVLKEMGFDVPSDAELSDLLIGVEAEDAAACERCRQLIMDLLDHKEVGGGDETYSSLDEIDFEATGYNLVQISIPGEYVVEETKKAVDKGCDVYIFSADISLEEELEIKEYGRDHHKLIMGPDCGVAQLNGVCLGAGSIYNYGPIGIVAASGSGSQEVGAVIERCGFGLTNLIGTGGRDLSKVVGGTAMMEGIKRYEVDPETKVIVLVSMLADRGVMDKVLSFADGCSKPVVAIFLGSDEKLFEGHKVHGTFSLEEAGLKAVELLTGKPAKQGYSDDELEAIAAEELKKYAPGQNLYRGYFMGGTFAEETLVYLTTHTDGIEFWSNRKNDYVKKLPDSFKSVGNTILDLGDTDFTTGAVHPVFDNTIRDRRMIKDLEECGDVAVVMIDFIGGPGLDFDPFEKTVKAFKDAEARTGRHITVIANIVGTYEDPQDFKTYVPYLRENGMIVTGSNMQSAKLARMIMEGLKK